MSVTILSKIDSMMIQLKSKIDELVKVKKSQDALHEFVDVVKKSIEERVSEVFEEKAKEKVKPKKAASKAKKAADDGAPKKPLSSYMIFCQENRASIVAKNPEASAKDIMSIFGVEWKKVDDKSSYEEKANKMKEEYQHKLEQWKKEHHSDDDSDEKKDEKKASKVKSDDEDEKEDKPKRPVSPYIRFCSEKRDEVKSSYPDLKPVDVTRKLGEMWRSLNEQEQAEYKK